jgi:hypothetical protein
MDDELPESGQGVCAATGVHSACIGTMSVRFRETGRHSILRTEEGGCADGCIGGWLARDVTDCKIGLSRQSFLYEQLAARPDHVDCVFKISVETGLSRQCARVKVDLAVRHARPDFGFLKTKILEPLP